MCTTQKRTLIILNERYFLGSSYPPQNKDLIRKPLLALSSPSTECSLDFLRNVFIGLLSC